MFFVMNHNHIFVNVLIDQLMIFLNPYKQPKIRLTMVSPMSPLMGCVSVPMVELAGGEYSTNRDTQSSIPMATQSRPLPCV